MVLAASAEWRKFFTPGPAKTQVPAHLPAAASAATMEPMKSLLFLLLALALPVRAEVLRLRYPVTPDVEIEQVYFLELLALALRKSGVEPVLVPAPKPMLQGRALAELAEGKLDVVWTMTTREREQALYPIRIPIDRGLYGWRVMLVRPQDQARFAALADGAALKRLSAGQGHDWPDTDILRANGLPVVTTPNYPGLFKMLALGRFDHFPRSVAEVLLEQKQQPDFAVAPRWALHYPTAFYYFVAPGNEGLARRIATGLERALADGSFRRLFCASFGAMLDELDMDRREIVELANPGLPPRTPLARTELWYRAGPGHPDQSCHPGP